MSWKTEHVCPSCGSDPNDWLEDGMLKDPPPLMADSVRCYGCITLKNEEKMAGEAQDGVTFFLVPYDRQMMLERLRLLNEAQEEEGDEWIESGN